MYHLENTLMALALHLSDQLNHAAEREVGHNLSDASTLVMVQNNGPIPIHLLSATLGVTHPAAVQQVDRLYADGLLERSVGADRRRRLITLTAKGRKRVGAFLKKRAALARQSLAGLKKADRTALQQLLDRMLSSSATDRPTVDHLCRCCDERACPPVVCPAERQVAAVPSPLTASW